MEEEWVRGPLLGTGSFATVNIAAFHNQNHSSSSLLVAVKSSLLSDSTTLQSEKDVLVQLNGCPHIVSYYGNDVTVENGEEYYNIFLEYVPGGSLSNLVASHGPLPEAVVSRYVRSVLEGLRFVHQKGYVHCDVKLQNLLVDGGGCGVKIADFGLAKKAGVAVGGEGGRRFSLRGTPLYMAPESVGCNEYEMPADIWAVGCAMVEMATGKPAWVDCGLARLLIRIGVGDELPEIPDELSEDGKDFLRKCFVRDPKERWTAEMLLNHPFVAASEENDNHCLSLESPRWTTPKTIFDFPLWVSIKSPASSFCSSDEAMARIEQLAAASRWPEWESSMDGGWITLREAESPVSQTQKLKAMVTGDSTRVGNWSGQLVGEIATSSDNHFRLASPPLSCNLSGRTVAAACVGDREDCEEKRKSRKKIIGSSFDGNCIPCSP